MYKATVEFYDNGEVVGTFVAGASMDNTTVGYTDVRNLVTRINSNVRPIPQLEAIATAMDAQTYRAVLVA